MLPFYLFDFSVAVAVDQAVFVEPLTEERAARTLYRIELLRKIREQVRLKGCGCTYGGGCMLYFAFFLSCFPFYIFT